MLPGLLQSLQAAREVALLCAAFSCACLLATAASAQDAPETQLPLRLVGTFVGDPATRSLAIIEDARAGKTLVLGEGQSIGELRIEHIQPGAVVMQRGDRREQVLLAHERASYASRELATAPGARNPGLGAAPHAAAPRPGPAAFPLRPPPERAARPLALRDEDVALTGDSPASLDPEGELRELSVKHGTTLEALTRQATFTPQIAETGGISGIAVSGIIAGSTLEKIGLRNGDTIISVNGTPMESPQALPTLGRLDPRNDGMAIGVNRGGVQTELEVPAGAL